MLAARALLRRATTVAGAAVAAATALATAVPAHAEEPLAELSIVVENVTQGTVSESFLTCDPDGGTHPDPTGACDRLRAIHGDLDELRFGPAPCPLFYDPRRVRITGTISGGEVFFAQDYANTCFVDRLAGPIVPPER